MTRKCVLCKGTNYKRTYSFFSAPKDPDTRKKWQEVIPIANYTVTDDTYICSKHFKQSDIITHWVSGIPPHVITIKYKKCRLRNGAIPCLNFEGNYNPSPVAGFDHFPLQPPPSTSEDLTTDEINFVIPREKDVQSINLNSQVTESCFTDTREIIEAPCPFERYNIVDNEKKSYFNKMDQIVQYDNRTCIINDDRMQDSASSAEDKGFAQSDNCFSYKYSEKHNEEANILIMDDKLRESLDIRQSKLRDPMINRKGYSKARSCNVKCEQDVEESANEESTIEEVDPLRLHIEHHRDNANTKYKDISENNHRSGEKQRGGDFLLVETPQFKTEKTYDEENINSALCHTMLFEDLLEIYTEVPLPRGWTSLVTSKGYATTVVYLYMNLPMNHIPIVEKEVYIKSDMVMHCVVGSKEMNPYHHNLVRDGKNIKVHALSDIEELIDELDHRNVCEGGPNVQNFQAVDVQIAYVDGMKWRHIGCSLIINNGSLKCSKCAALNNIFIQRKNKNTSTLSSDSLLQKQKEIERLRRLLKKMTKRNQKLKEIRLSFKNKFKLLLTNSENTMKNAITSSNMPDIQKLMIKECLKASVIKNKKHVHYSETWIFLCLLLYVESPRMYKYMFVKNYMSLPSLLTIRKYLVQIKMNPQFYNLFQQSIEPYLPAGKQDEEKKI